MPGSGSAPRAELVPTMNPGLGWKQRMFHFGNSKSVMEPGTKGPEGDPCPSAETGKGGRGKSSTVQSLWRVWGGIQGPLHGVSTR